MTDEETTLHLYRTHRVALTQYARRIVGDHACAEDVVQEAYLRFDAASEKLLNEPVGYLYRIVRNLALDNRRRQVREARYFVREDGAGESSGCAVVSDGLQCFARVTDAGCTHQAIKTGSGVAAVRTPAFKWVNTALGNIKAAIVGTYRSIDTKHVPRYLAEFQCRFNRRYDLVAILPRLCWASLRTPPMPYRLLKLAEVYA